MYIDKIKNGTTEYDLQDARLTCGVEDVGKIVTVNSNGELVLETPQSGGGGGATLLWSGSVVGSTGVNLSDFADSYTNYTYLIVQVGVTREASVLIPAQISGYSCFTGYYYRAGSYTLSMAQLWNNLTKIYVASAYEPDGTAYSTGNYTITAVYGIS